MAIACIVANWDDRVRSNPIFKMLLIDNWWTGLDSNQRTENRADLQSAAFNHSATCPLLLRVMSSRAKAGPTKEAAQWRNGPCLSMLQMGKGNQLQNFIGRGLKPPSFNQRQHLELVRLPIPLSWHEVAARSASFKSRCQCKGGRRSQ